MSGVQGGKTGAGIVTRRWRLTSAAVLDSAAEQRSAGWACWRGNAAGLGGWTFVTRISLTTLQTTGMGFFGLYGSTAALATTLTLAAVVNCIGIGFQRGTHTRWQLVTNDGTRAPTLTDMGASFGIATGGVDDLVHRGPTERQIKEGKYAFRWTRLPCKRFRDNEV